MVKAPQVEIQVESISFHSKKLGHNCLFVCKGNNFKKEYLEAIHHQLSAYISEVDYEVELPLILVKDVLKAMALLADALYDHPSRDLNLIGITGTKGKTSSLYFLKSILDAHSKKGDTAYLGSVEIYNGDHIVPSLLTTPESLTLQQIFRDVKENLKLEYAVSFIGRLISRMSPVVFVSKEFLTNNDIKLYEDVIDRLIKHNEKYKKVDFVISKESIKYLPMNTKIFFQVTNKKVGLRLF